MIAFLRDLCAYSGRTRPSILKAKDRTSWLDEPNIRIELDLESVQGKYRYELVMGFNPAGSTDIVLETLILDEQTLFTRREQRVQLRPDLASKTGLFPISPDTSVVAIVGSEYGGEDIVPFREYLDRILYLKPLPLIASSGRLVPYQTRPDVELEEFVGWYLGLAQDPDFVVGLIEDLRSVWPELVEIMTPEYSSGHRGFALRVKSDWSDAKPLDISLDALSDGERMLIALYVVAAYQRTHAPTTIMIDEPDNFVSILELQPWLLTMLDDRPDDGQLILVSHNPEIIQTMGRSRAAWFEREDHLSPTRVSRIEPDGTGLPLSESIARGWVNA